MAVETSLQVCGATGKQITPEAATELGEKIEKALLVVQRTLNRAKRTLEEGVAIGEGD